MCDLPLITLWGGGGEGLCLCCNKILQQQKILHPTSSALEESSNQTKPVAKVWFEFGTKVFVKIIKLKFAKILKLTLALDLSKLLYGFVKVFQGFVYVATLILLKFVHGFVVLYLLLSAKESPAEVCAKFRNFEKRVLIKLKHSIP